jgi:hypothetical protein
MNRVEAMPSANEIGPAARSCACLSRGVESPAKPPSPPSPDAGLNRFESGGIPNLSHYPFAGLPPCMASARA